MGTKVGLIIAAVGGFLVLLWFMSQSSAQRAAITAGMPQTTSLPLTPATPSISLAPLAAPGSPSMVSPFTFLNTLFAPRGVTGAAPVIDANGNVVSSGGSGVATGYLSTSYNVTTGLPDVSPSLIIPQTAPNTYILASSANGVSDPSYSSDTSVSGLTDSGAVYT